jgi:hypothetical protein
MTGVLARGLAAGAAGSTVLTTVRHLDTALRGRPPSRTPERVVDAVARASGRKLPRRGAAAEARRASLAALSGIGGGMVTGVLASALRAAGIRLPAPVGALAAGAAAMAAADVPAAVLGVRDPSARTPADWAAEATPHLAYGAAVQAVLEAIPSEREQVVPRGPAGAGLAVRSALLGVAAGSRSSLGWAMPTLTAPSRRGTPEHRSGLARITGLAAVAGELVGDQQRGIPDRTVPAGAAPRFVGAAAGAAQLATRARANAALPVLVAAGGAAAGTWGGAAWRHWAAGRLPDGRAGLVEDGVALLLAALACLPGRSTRGPLWVRRIQWVEAG